MQKKIYLLMFVFFIVGNGCNTDNINDQSKRNIRWVWWVDASTNKSQWIPVGDKRTVKNGKYTKFYYNGLTYEAGTIKDGKNTDTTFWFDLKGKIYAYKLYKADSAKIFYVNNGYLRVFADNGRVEGEGIIANHVIGGQWTQYYNSGFIWKIYNYIHDTGWLVKYYDNQQIDDSMFVMGDSSIEIKHWYRDGQLAHVIGWENNKYNGEFRDYYDNGQLMQKGYYRNGKLNGEGMYWYKSGNLKGISNYVNGVRSGKQVIYFKNKQIQLIGNLIDGKLDGEQKIYDQGGKLIKHLFIRNGLDIFKQSN